MFIQFFQEVLHYAADCGIIPDVEYLKLQGASNMKKYVSSILVTAMLSMSLVGCGASGKDNSSDSVDEAIVQAGAFVTEGTESSEAITTEAATETTTKAATTETATETTTEAATTETVTETTAESATASEAATESTTETAEAKEVFALNGPLARKQSVKEFDNAEFAASFTMDKLVKNEEGAYTLTVKIYRYEYFSGDDILSLKTGDTVYCLGQPVKVETIETGEGMVRINGGIENGGRIFKTNDNTIYFESGMNDRKSYYIIGENTYTLSDNFTMTDNSVMESPKTYTAEEFAAFSDDAAGFRNSNTIVKTTDGMISSIVRNYIP